MEVNGSQSSVPIEWTLKHHKQFVDAATRLGLDDFRPTAAGAGTKLNTLISELMNSAAMKDRVLLPTLKYHMDSFQLLQKTTRDSLLQSLSSSSSGSSLPPWTVEHHKRFVEAVIELGGLEKAKPAAILGLMKEERRRGLTVPIVGRHLLGLRSLHNKTRNKAIVDANSEKIDRYRKIIHRLNSARF